MELEGSSNTSENSFELNFVLEDRMKSIKKKKAGYCVWHMDVSMLFGSGRDTQKERALFPTVGGLPIALRL